MSTPEPPKSNDWFADRTQTVVRALLALILVIAYIAFQAFGVEISQGLELLVGAGAGFFIGAVPSRKA